jgi:uncharacterized protein YodC (DUF2158 family)
MPKFEIGATAKLKSGGPIMTVSWIPIAPVLEEEDGPKLQCTWFEGSKQMWSTFDPRVLVTITM